MKWKKNIKNVLFLLLIPLEFYEYNRMAFGLANAPATYQRLIKQCLGELHLKVCFIYLDDIIIFSKTYEEHLD